ncbi:hypothetical protein [Amycolatopsis sp. CA-230715]|uniref:hypothetical protein n=1 Tax=Amycolatopsis sp. CA-230715 TaxID=2745196 RepID=UPI001C015921|nr:hypothetical protein [Amycolatopsis sp. CA-230715]QWF76681.1 hypothetical protein HUW46_00057 [Amycolatopsis sp. CA-230715]
MSETEDPKPASTEPPAFTPSVPETDYTDGGVPTFDFVKDRIEKRAATAEGSTELAGLGTGQDMAALDKKIADRDEAAKDKLAEIRKAMRGE